MNATTGGHGRPAYTADEALARLRHCYYLDFIGTFSRA